MAKQRRLIKTLPSSSLSEKQRAIIGLIQKTGGQKNLGLIVGRDQRTISCWLRGNPVPPKKAFELEKLAKRKGLGHITAKILTPEIDW